MTIQEDSGTHATLADLEDASDSKEILRGSNLGRYVIIEPIGSGGMGTVYRAYDPQLNRGVALKILSVKHTDLQAVERAKARLIREAQALAQLSHPNVVAVHDAGTFENDVFIAMELVEGKTLDKWLRQEKRSVKETLEVMSAAGRGLSAAHKAGLVHRDFKPGNVIVGDDGRVRVLDFGLARVADQEEPMDKKEVNDHDVRSQESEDAFEWKKIASDSSLNLLESPLTNAGGILGTPLYMAPEQHLGQKTDERTDQFGFCVVLYEVLYGRRPFIATTIEELKSEVLRQQVCVPQADADVPSWLWQAISKGLRVKPEERYATIDSLLAELDKDPEEVRRQNRMIFRRRLLVVSVLVLMVVVPFGVWYGLRYRTFHLCRDAQSEFEGIWDYATKNLVRKSFLSLDRSFAQGTWERVEQITDRYLSEWKQMRSDICEAKLLRATLSEKVFDLQMNCLRRRRRELKALIDVFAQTDEQILQKAVQASSSLAGIRSCVEEDLRLPYPPPKTAEDRAKVAGIRDKLNEVVAFVKTGKYQVGLEMVKNLERESSLLSYRPIQAEVSYWLGALLSKAGEYEKAETVLLEAARASGEMKDTLLAAKALAELVWVFGNWQARYKEAMAFAQNAQIMLSVAGGESTLRSRILNNIGVVSRNMGDYDKALSHYRRSVAIKEKICGSEHPEMISSYNNIGLVYQHQGRYAQALEVYSKSLAIGLNTLGPDHPAVGATLNNLGIVYRSQGKLEQSIETYQKALRVQKKAMGHEHPEVADQLSNLGGVFFDLGKYDRALDCFREALKIRKKALGPQHHMVSKALNKIGFVLSAQGHYDKALEHLRNAMAIATKTLGHNHRQVAFALNNIGEVYQSKAQYNEAIKYYRKSKAILVKALGSDHFFVAESLSNIGGAFAQLGNYVKSLAYLEQALDICKKKKCKPDLHGSALFAGAQALAATGGDQMRAISLAKKAQQVFAKNPKRFEKNTEEVNAWLRASGGR